MVYTDVDVWSDIMNGDVASGVFNALNNSLGGYLIFIFYLIISLVLWIRTGSIELCAIISLIFLSSFLITPWFNETTLGLALIITTLEIGLSIFKFFAKEKSV